MTEHIQPEKHPSIEKSDILERLIWNRVHKRNKNFMAAVVGETGSGKSYAALRLAEILDPEFTVDKVTFSVRDFFKDVKKERKPGSVTVFDEAGVNLGSRDWYTELNKKMSHILQTWRHQRRIALFTVPSLKNLDSDARARLHGIFRTDGIDYQNEVARVKYYKVKEHPVGGQVIHPYPVLKSNDDNMLNKIEGLKLSKPSESLREAYEDKAEQFKNQVVDEALEVTEEDEDDEKTAKEIFEEIKDEERETEFISLNNGQKYVDKTLIEAEFEAGPTKAKRVKALLKRYLDREELM